MASLSLHTVSKTFNSIQAVDGVSLDIASGEFFSILGPSGCGKTTLLRMIAGFEACSAGRILLDGNDITHLQAQDRGIGMVFQNYALFPHMTVFRNIAFGLEARKVPAPEIRRRVEAILESVKLTDKIDTPVPYLSGGEQQRVAVARALVVEPAVLLFDEPLSNLDIALRLQTREEIRSLQRRTGITTVYVTHDQSEAMSLSHRIAVMRSGRFEQVASPADIYESPATPFVAGFVGGGNLIHGTLAGNGKFSASGFSLALPASLAAGEGEGPAILAIKPESLVLRPETERCDISVQIEDREFLGFTTNFVVSIGGYRLHASALSSPATKLFAPGAHAGVCIDWSSCTLFRSPR